MKFVFFVRQATGVESSGTLPHKPEDKQHLRDDSDSCEDQHTSSVSVFKLCKSW